MKKICLTILGIILWHGFSGYKSQAQENGLKVAEAKLGRRVEEREIVGEDSVFSLNERVYLWLKITGGTFDTISVTWKFEDYSYTYGLLIEGSPWRTWAYKTVWKAGDWTVMVTNSEGNVLNEMAFKVKKEMKAEKKEEEEKKEKTD